VSLSLNVPVILASTSPRRIELLKQVGISFSVTSPDAHEKRKSGEPPKAMTARLAREKADSVIQHALLELGSALIIAADTIVVAPDGKHVLGKPNTPKEAQKMLKTLAGKTHTVFTGYCILSVARGIRPVQVVRVVSSKVKMRALSKQMIEFYVKTGEPMDKAGSYAAQGIGMSLIERISGSYTNIVGLPIAQLLMDLEKKFGLSPFDMNP
jgi:septum formation protein